MEVKQLGLGVARSNGVMLQPEYNTQTVAFVHRFETQGLRFKLSDHMKAALEERVAQDGNTPFSAQTLQLLDYIIRHSHQDLGHHDGFIIEAYLDVLVDNAWRLETAGLSTADSFPETEADFLELLFESGHPLSPESVQRRKAQFSAVANDALADDIQASLNAFIPAFSAFYNGTVKPEPAWRKRWYGATLANTMGVLLADAITEYAGVQGGSVATPPRFGTMNGPLRCTTTNPKETARATSHETTSISPLKSDKRPTISANVICPLKASAMRLNVDLWFAWNMNCTTVPSNRMRRRKAHLLGSQENK